MRKYFIGILIGFCLSLGVGAHAEVSSFVGRMIEGSFPVTYNAAPLGDALVLDGTTYLPVRKLGEAMGLTVSFNADLGVSLTKSVTETTYAKPQEVKPVVTIPTNTDPVVSNESKLKELQAIESRIETVKLKIIGNERGIESMVKRTPNDPMIAQITQMTEGFRAELADLERQKAELTK